MAQKKLFLLLGELDGKDLKQFNQFLQSGLERVQPRELNAWNTLYQLIEEAGFSAQIDWVGLEEKGPKMDRRVESQLSQLLQNYIEYQQFRSSRGLRHLVRLQAFNRDHLKKFFDQLFKKSDKELGKKNSRTLLLLHAMQEEQAIFQSRKTGRQPRESLERINASFDNYFLAQKLKYACALLTQKDIFANREQNPYFPLIDTIVAYLTEIEDTDPAREYDPLVWMFLQVYRLLKGLPEETDRAMDRLIELLDQHSDDYTLDEVRDLNQHVINYCIRNILTYNSQHHIAVLANRYHVLLEKGLLLNQEGKLSPNHFKNISMIMARNREAEWLDQFIEGYSGRLTGPKDTGAPEFGRGILKFFQGDYKTSRKYFEDVLTHHEDVFFGLDARVYITRTIFYERKTNPDWWIELDKFLASFRMAMRRRRDLISEFHINNYLEYIRALTQMSRLVEVPVKKEQWKGLKELKEELKGRENVGGKVWLMEQLEILMEENRA